MRLKNDLIWTLLTTSLDIKDHEKPKGFATLLGAKHGAGKTRTSWQDVHAKEETDLCDKLQSYYVKLQSYYVIIGAANA